MAMIGKLAPARACALSSSLAKWAISSAITPPTILHTSTLLGTGRQRCRWGRDTEDDVDFVVIDLDAFDEKPDQVAPQGPIWSGQALPDLFCEIFEPTDDERQGSA